VILCGTIADTRTRSPIHPAELDDGQYYAHHLGADHFARWGALPRKQVRRHFSFPEGLLVREHSFLKIGIVVALLVGGMAAPATAQIVSIRQGTFIITDVGPLLHGDLDISGTSGFKFEGGTDGGAGNFPAGVQCALEPACPPGTVIDLEGYWAGSDVGGTARLRGTTYQVGTFFSHDSAIITFSGQVTMPPMSDDPVSITVPFDFAGEFFYEVEDPLRVESVLLVGGGLVTLFLHPYQSYPDLGFESWSITRAEFVFRPVKR